MFFDTLSEEVMLQIISHLNHKELINFGTTNKDRHLRLSRDESLWKDLLLRDFHFTEKTLADSKGELTYQQFYQNCQNDEPSSAGKWLIDFLIMELGSMGLTENHLKGRRKFSHPENIDEVYASFLKKALVSLMTTYQLKEAVAALQGLTYDQLIGMDNGLTYKEVLDCVGKGVHTLVELKSLGLTSAMLAKLKPEFSLPHADIPFAYALIYLMKDHEPPYSAEEAIEQLKGKNLDQANHIADGNSPQSTEFRP